MKKKRLLVLFPLFAMLVLTGALSSVGGRNVASGTGDYTIDLEPNTYDLTVYPLTADIALIIEGTGSTAGAATNDTITVKAGTVFSWTQRVFKLTVDRTSATEVNHTWVKR